MAKSTLATIIDTIRLVEKLDAKGQMHVYRYLHANIVAQGAKAETAARVKKPLGEDQKAQ